jgi:predicted dehydrogenase
MLKMGMIGGGPDSMIGDVHRITAEATGKAQLVCAVLGTDFEKSKLKGKSIGIDEHRIYQNFEEMLAEESNLPKGQGMDFLIIATPNHLHVPFAIKALEQGFHVMCDKPLGINLEESRRLERIIEHTKLKFGMTYTYRGYAAIQEIQKQIKKGTIGRLRKVMIDYSQGWLSDLIEKDGQKQALWRTDPKFSGAGGTIADIGTHAFNLAEYVSGAKIEEICALVSTLVVGRKIDDDTNVLLKFANGITGTLSVSQVCAGEDNSLSIKVYGDKGGLLWNHSQPKKIIVKLKDGEDMINADWPDIDLNGVAQSLVGKHPDAFLKGFITIYSNFIDSINTGRSINAPNIEDGMRGMMFIEKAIESNKKRKWVAL